MKTEYPFSSEEYENRESIELGIGNYYGDVEVSEINGKYYLTLSNHNGIDYKEISNEFYEAIKKELNVEGDNNE
ncbi:hypothetical protein D7X33_39270 [Butyricicoccus sp. 1XD8-22]|nr:hypothetical protein D7X33_39270 [Butyricicoccus sp. 1XD8-22]